MNNTLPKLEKHERQHNKIIKFLRTKKEEFARAVGLDIIQKFKDLQYEKGLLEEIYQEEKEGTLKVTAINFRVLQVLKDQILIAPFFFNGFRT